MAAHVEIAEESTPKRAFVWSIEWPGWCRGGKDLDLARTAFLEAAARYADVAALAGMLPEGFIPSSSATASNANPEVWTNMADFQQKAADLKTAADALAATAASQGFEAAKGMVQAAGSTCGACHRPYRRRAQAEQ